ncbi:MAG: DUF4870 family protein [Rhizomicrobium sp.]
MSDTPQPNAGTVDTRILAIICYALFIAAFTNGLTAIVGVVLAYVKRGEVRGTIWESHFANMIQVFWTGIAFMVVFIALALFGAFGVWHTAMTDRFAAPMLVLPVLWLAGVAYIIWYLYRTVRGILLALENKAYS